MTLQARPTTYAGIQMRSRLEATVAANLDRWGYDWRYEPRAYGSRSGQYLPDFELWIGGELRTVVEVKGELVEDLGATFKRMRIVWESEPDANLALIEAEAMRTGAFDAPVPRFAFLFDFKALHEHGQGPVPAVFALCPCGTVGIRLVGSGELFWRCRGCDADGSAVAFLNPTEYRP